ncbi:MAG: hypothetical protein Q7S47_00450 [bacterium]|nr:hypothetical protein [bacterium]
MKGRLLARFLLDTMQERRWIRMENNNEKLIREAAEKKRREAASQAGKSNFAKMVEHESGKEVGSKESKDESKK